MLGTGSSARVRMYTHEKDVTAENWARACWVMAHPGHRPFTGPLAVRVEVVQELPARARDAVRGAWADYRTAALVGRARPIGKPDPDNVAKLYLDGLNGTAWLDDSQIADLRVVKRYADSGEQLGVRIEVTAGLWVSRPAG